MCIIPATHLGIGDRRAESHDSDLPLNLGGDVAYSGAHDLQHRLGRVVWCVCVCVQVYGVRVKVHHTQFGSLVPRPTPFFLFFGFH